MLELIKNRKRNWLDHWLRKNCLLKDALEVMVNGKKVRGRRYQMIDNIMINGLYLVFIYLLSNLVELRPCGLLFHSTRLYTNYMYY